MFTARGVQLGSENEALRNLLLDATAKVEELDGIKNAVTRLVDPVGKALKVIESEHADKIALQTVLNNTRTAYGKLRSEAAELEKKAAATENECRGLRQELTTTQSQLKTRGNHQSRDRHRHRRPPRADRRSRMPARASRRARARRCARRPNGWASACRRARSARSRSKSELNGARQRLVMAEDEKRAQLALLDKASAEAARLARKVTETEAALAAVQGRLRHVEADFAEVSIERTRLTGALDEANERHKHEITSQRTRFDALQARAQASEKLLGEAREHLLARAEDLREQDRRASDLANERDGLQTRLAELGAERITRESEYTELEQSHNALTERAASLLRAFAAKESALERAEGTIAALNQRMAALE